MHIRNVTLEHDSEMGTYWCYAYAEGDNKGVKYGFSINVIESKIDRHLYLKVKNLKVKFSG